MKIFFDRGGEQSTLIHLIIDLLKSKNHDIVYEQKLHEIFDLPNLIATNEGIPSIKAGQKLVSLCDCLILHRSKLNIENIGYKVHLAQKYNKPVLIFKLEDEVIPHINIKANKTILSEENYKIEIEGFLGEVNEKKYKKFILNLPSEMNEYIEWKSKHKQKFKSELLRSYIEKSMKKDKKWTNYLSHKF